MPRCSHKRLILLKERGDRLRCRKCHLTLAPDELGSRGVCPECYAVSGERRTDFEEIPGEKGGIAKYRCEDCGALIEWKG